VSTQRQTQRRKRRRSRPAAAQPQRIAAKAGCRQQGNCTPDSFARRQIAWTPRSALANPEQAPIPRRPSKRVRALAGRTPRQQPRPEPASSPQSNAPTCVAEVCAPPWAANPKRNGSPAPAAIISQRCGAAVSIAHPLGQGRAKITSAGICRADHATSPRVNCAPLAARVDSREPRPGTSTVNRNREGSRQRLEGGLLRGKSVRGVSRGKLSIKHSCGIVSAPFTLYRSAEWLLMIAPKIRI